MPIMAKISFVYHEQRLKYFSELLIVSKIKQFVFVIPVSGIFFCGYGNGIVLKESGNLAST